MLEGHAWTAGGQSVAKHRARKWRWPERLEVRTQGEAIKAWTEKGEALWPRW